MASIAFYANGKNKVDNVVVAAYLYIENCSTNNQNEVAVIDQMPGVSSLIYYNNLTYNNGQNEYTYNRGAVKNIYMAPDDWDWVN